MKHSASVFLEGQNLRCVHELLQPIHESQNQPLGVRGDGDGEGSLVAGHAHSLVPHVDVAKSQRLAVICCRGPASNSYSGLGAFLAAAFYGDLGGQRVPIARDLSRFHLGCPAAVGNVVLTPQSFIQLPNAGLRWAFAHVIVERIGCLLETVVGKTDEVALGLGVAGCLLPSCWIGFLNEQQEIIVQSSVCGLKPSELKHCFPPQVFAAIKHGLQNFV